MKRILVVDDEYLIRYSLSHMLQDSSSQVTAVPTGAEALQESVRARYDLCCVDIHLPDMNGVSVMKQIKSAWPPARIIMMTGGHVSDAMLLDIHAHAALLLSKPFDLFKVKAFVDLLLELSDSAYHTGDAAAPAPPVPENENGTEKRRYERRPSETNICFEPLPAVQDHTRGAQVANVSGRGMCLVTNCPLATGSRIRIMGPAVNGREAVVRWSRSTDEGTAFRCGVEFP